MIVAAALAVAGSGSVAAQGISATARFGTLGLGVDGSLGLGPRLAVRAGVGFQPWEPTREIEDIDFELNLPSPAWMAALDLYVAGPLRVSGGLVAFGSDIEVTGRLTGNVEIGNDTYSPQEVGTLTGVFDTRDVAPWAGVGLGKRGLGLGFSMDLGVVFAGEPAVSLSADGPLAGQPSFQANLAREEQNIQEDASLVKWYPVLSLGLTFGF